MITFVFFSSFDLPIAMFVISALNKRFLRRNNTINILIIVLSIIVAYVVCIAYESVCLSLVDVVRRSTGTTGLYELIDLLIGKFFHYFTSMIFGSVFSIFCALITSLIAHVYTLKKSHHQ